MKLQANEIENMIDCLSRAREHLSSMLPEDVGWLEYKNISHLIIDIQNINLKRFMAEIDRLIVLDQNIKKLLERLEVKNRS